MVCGDKRGNVTVFPLMEGLISSDCCDLLEKISPLDSFKGAHGISSVTSICVGVPNFSHVEIFTVRHKLYSREDTNFIHGIDIGCHYYIWLPFFSSKMKICRREEMAVSVSLSMTKMFKKWNLLG